MPAGLSDTMAHFEELRKKEVERREELEVSISTELPQNHPFYDMILYYKPSSYWGTPMTMEIPKSFQHWIHWEFDISPDNGG